MAEVLKSSWVSQPEDIAKAIWEAVRKKQSEVVVGPVMLATEIYRLFPNLVQFMMSKR